MTSDVFLPTTMKTTTLSPFATQQVQIQEDYARRTLAEQQTVFTRPNQRPIAQSLSQELQVQPLSVSRQHPQQSQPLRFLDRDGQVRQQNFVPQQQDFIAPQQHDIVPQQRDFVPQPRQKNVGSTQTEEAFSYAQVQFGPTTATTRTKGQRSVSRPRINQVVVEPITQQSVDYSSITVRPEHFRLLQNVVYIQPNGQMYKPIEDAEPVVHIPRKNHYPQQPQQQWPVISDGPTTGASSTSTTTTAVSPIEEEQVVLIPRPKKPNQQRFRHEGRKSGRAQQAARTESLQEPEYQIQQQQQLQQQQSSEVEPDNFLTSLLSRLQLQHQQQQETTGITTPKARGSQRSKGGNRPGASKYLPDTSQLQLLQFPHELKSLSTAELKALEEASVQIAEANDRSVVRQKLLQRNTPVSTTVADDVVATTATSTPAEVEELHESPRQFHENNRPVPTPVQLNEQQRQFLASQGIRHLYRVDYDQSGKVLPLTYVLALDNRSKRTEQQQEQ